MGGGISRVFFFFRESLYIGAMRVTGDFWEDDCSDSDEEVKGNERDAMLSPSPSRQQKLVVGYALTSKKIKSFLQPKLVAFARFERLIQFFVALRFFFKLLF